MSGYKDYEDLAICHSLMSSRLFVTSDRNVYPLSVSWYQNFDKYINLRQQILTREFSFIHNNTAILIKHPTGQHCLSVDHDHTKKFVLAVSDQCRLSHYYDKVLKTFL